MRVPKVVRAGVVTLLAGAGLLMTPAAANASAGGCSVYLYAGSCFEINGNGTWVNWMRGSTDNKQSHYQLLETCIDAPYGRLACGGWKNVKPGGSTGYTYAPGNRSYAPGSYCARSYAQFAGGQVRNVGGHCLNIH
jgi:hypothetical protein